MSNLGCDTTTDMCDTTPIWRGAAIIWFSYYKIKRRCREKVEMGALLRHKGAILVPFVEQQRKIGLSYYKMRT